MKATLIACANCGRSWKLSLFDPLYLQLELSSRPCPHCEAYTLSCQETRESSRQPSAVSRPPEKKSRQTRPLAFPVWLTADG